MEHKHTLYLIDGSAYMYRAYHAIAGLASSKGFPTNAVFGFTKMLVKLMEEKNPEYLAVAFDMRGPTFRHEIYPDYKTNRPPMPDDLADQIPYIKSIIKGFNIPLVEQEGYEADDVMGTLAHQAESAGFAVVMVTGDKDFLQLITENISIWDSMRDKQTTLVSIRQDFGVAPLQMIDVMGLAGDTSDNIPGVPGIGMKTALSLIQTFGSMDRLYEQVETISRKKQRENLMAFKDQALLSRELVRIRTDASTVFDPDRFKVKSPDMQTLSEIFQELEFNQFLKDPGPAPDAPARDYSVILDMKSLEELAARLETAEIFALDTETTSTDPMKAHLVGLSFSVKPDQAVYIPVGHDYLAAPSQLPMKTVLDVLRPVLENSTIKKVGQNIKYDWIVLERHGIKLAGVVFDTMVASYLINPSKRAHSLDRIAADFLNRQSITFEEAAGKNAAGFNHVLLKDAVPYACEDADVTLTAHSVLSRRLSEIGLSDLMDSVEVPLIPVLKDMEMRGVGVDRDRLRMLSKSFEHQLEQVQEDIWSAAGERFNIHSSQQMGYILFEKLKLPVQKKTQKKTGYSTDVEVLKTLAGSHELPALVLRHRTLTKLKSTYADALLDLIHPETGRIHTSYNQTVAATGRLSSSDPNLQNIPVRTPEGAEIRKAFVPKEGWLFLSADYSQIELRLLAHYSDDDILIQAFKDGEDIHARTAAEVFQLPADMMPPELRHQAKAINFGIIYGMGSYSLSKDLNVTRKMAQTYINNYFSRYQGVKKFIDRTIETARQTGQTSTLLGRIRLLPEISSSNRNIRMFAERMAVNTPIQGSAADLIKMAMIRAHQVIQDRKLQSAMLLSVHDEMVFEVPPEELEIMKTLVKECMEGVWPDMKVPLTVNISAGTNWAEAH